MTNKFKQLAAQGRASIPKVNPEKPADDDATQSATPPAVTPIEAEKQQNEQTANAAAVTTGHRPLFLTPVDSSQKPEGWGIHGYPTRKQQVNDLAYQTGKRPWQIVEAALEEYVVRHYGKEHERK